MSKATTAAVELAHGHIYRAKRPQPTGLFTRLYNDRQIVYLSETKVQYDSPTVANGRKYPTVTRKAFENWASKDVTKGYPKDDWEEFHE